MKKLKSSHNHKGFVLLHTLVFVLYFSSFFVQLSIHHNHIKEQVVLFEKAKIISNLHYVIVDSLRSEDNVSQFDYYEYTISIEELNDSEYLIAVSGPTTFTVHALIEVENQTIKSYNYTGQ